ncbi:hypothetical protein JZ751_019589 [Albula glossodonta]|uniref:Uncharacterized protein n=1 Tax=Albula glossodonta TaxID=121402 RepID=A0A8T2NPP0_9TELE|nr:hypothetical protein JZ751_019589 [Albula glossodonta]
MAAVVPEIRGLQTEEVHPQKHRLLFEVFDENRLCNLIHYSCYEQEIATTALKNAHVHAHLWYLTPELRVLDFFDDMLSEGKKTLPDQPAICPLSQKAWATSR